MPNLEGYQEASEVQEEQRFEGLCKLCEHKSPFCKKAGTLVVEEVVQDPDRPNKYPALVVFEEDESEIRYPVIKIVREEEKGSFGGFPTPAKPGEVRSTKIFNSVVSDTEGFTAAMQGRADECNGPIKVTIQDGETTREEEVCWALGRPLLDHYADTFPGDPLTDTDSVNLNG